MRLSNNAAPKGCLLLWSNVGCHTKGMRVENSSQSSGSYEFAYDNAVYRVVQLLEDGSGGNGQKEHDQFADYIALGQVVFIERFFHALGLFLLKPA